MRTYQQASAAAHVAAAQSDYTARKAAPSAGNESGPPKDMVSPMSKEVAQERYELLCAQLGAKRKNLALTQTAVARILGTLQHSISKIERALVQASPITIIRIGGTLGLELMWIPRHLVAQVRKLVSMTAPQAWYDCRPDDEDTAAEEEDS